MSIKLFEKHQSAFAQIWIALFVASFYVVPVDWAKPLWYVLLGLASLITLKNPASLKDIATKTDIFLILLFLLALARGFVPDALPDGQTTLYTKHLSNLALLLLLFLSMSWLFETRQQNFFLWALFVCASLSVLLNLCIILIDESGLQSQFINRAVYIGRMRDPNMYGVSLALGILCGVYVFLNSNRLIKLLVGVGLVLLFAGLLYTKSRGAVIALGVPFLFLIVHHFRPQTRLFFWAMANLAFISALVGFEDVIASTLCKWITLPRCTSSTRFEIWVWTYDLVKEHPWLGVGAGFRFDHADTGQVSPHHVLWGTALYFGIPMLVAFLVALYRITRHVEAHAPALSAFFILGCGFMATNLAQPFAFINWHYLFLWLPLFYYAAPLPVQQRFVHTPNHAHS